MRNVTELQEDAMDHLQQPKTSILDNHTRIFILLAKRTVTGGRATAVLPTDIGLPFPKKDIPKETRISGAEKRHPCFALAPAPDIYIRENGGLPRQARDEHIGALKNATNGVFRN